MFKKSFAFMIAITMLIGLSSCKSNTASDSFDIQNSDETVKIQDLRSSSYAVLFISTYSNIGFENNSPENHKTIGFVEKDGKYFWTVSVLNGRGALADEIPTEITICREKDKAFDENSLYLAFLNKSTEKYDGFDDVFVTVNGNDGIIKVVGDSKKLTPLNKNMKTDLFDTVGNKYDDFSKWMGWENENTNTKISSSTTEAATFDYTESTTAVNIFHNNSREAPGDEG